MNGHLQAHRINAKGLLCNCLQMHIVFNSICLQTYSRCSDCLIAFWDGTSRGTKYTIDYAKQQGKPIKIVNYTTNELTYINN